MDLSVGSRLKHAWNAFRVRDETEQSYIYQNIGSPSSYNPTRHRFSIGNERSIITAVYNRIAMDVAAYDIQHVRVDSNGRYLETMKSGLQNCLEIEANKDQTGRSFLQDIAMSLFDEGVVAIVPIDTTLSPMSSGSYEINTMRTGKIVEWYPDYIKVELYNDRTGQREQVTVPKYLACIIENPLYSVMNEPNSTVKRLIHKLNILDAIDDQSGSGKLDLIIQLPYAIKSPLRQQQAEDRRKAIESQLSGTKYGIAYIDGTEHVTQLNRPAENNLMGQITYLTTTMYNQLGMTEDVFNGKADDKAMLNYYNRTVEPIVTAIIEEMRRKFLTKTARSQGQTIMGFRDEFRLVPAWEMADIADSLTRNEIMSSNEVRAVLGMKPSNTPQADELRNKNMPVSTSNEVSDDSQNGSVPIEDVQAMMSDMASEYESAMKDTLDGVQKDVDSVLGG